MPFVRSRQSNLRNFQEIRRPGDFRTVLHLQDL
jgi:hypothetical protein